METESGFDIVVIGAGIVGLALARALCGQGLSLALIDARAPDSAPLAPLDPESPRFQPRVSALAVASINFLESLGAWHAVSARACPYEEMHVWDAEGTGSIHFSAADVFQKNLGFIVENAVVTASLERQLDGRSDLHQLRPARVAALRREPGDDGHRHTVELEDGRLLRCRLLIGADGANSVVRKGLAFRTEEWDYGHRAIVTTVRTERSHRYTAWQRFMPSGPLAFLPLVNPASSAREEQHWSSIVWSCVPELAEELMALDDAGFAPVLENAFESRLGRIEWVDRRHAFPLRQMHAVDYVEDGVALVGDAAHTIHPLAGQGVNLGLMDAAVLAGVIEDAHARSEDFADLRILSRYQRRRKGPNLGMMALMEGFKRLFESDDLMLRWMRNTGITAVDRLPLLKKELMARAMGLGA